VWPAVSEGDSSHAVAAVAVEQDGVEGASSEIQLIIWATTRFSRQGEIVCQGARDTSDRCAGEKELKCQWNGIMKKAAEIRSRRRQSIVISPSAFNGDC